jgi:hypothetical protein
LILSWQQREQLSRTGGSSKELLDGKMDYYELKRKSSERLATIIKQNQTFSISNLSIEFSKSFGISKNAIIKMLRDYETAGKIQIKNDEVIVEQ